MVEREPFPIVRAIVVNPVVTSTGADLDPRPISSARDRLAILGHHPIFSPSTQPWAHPRPPGEPGICWADRPVPDLGSGVYRPRPAILDQGHQEIDVRPRQVWPTPEANPVDRLDHEGNTTRFSTEPNPSPIHEARRADPTARDSSWSAQTCSVTGNGRLRASLTASRTLAILYRYLREIDISKYYRLLLPLDHIAVHVRSSNWAFCHVFSMHNMDRNMISIDAYT